MSGSGQGTQIVVSTLEYTTLGQLITAFRTETDDTATPPLWSDTDITRYANDAVRDAVERGLLIEDDATADICQITVTANTAAYPLDPRILKIKRVTLASTNRMLPGIDQDSLDRGIRPVFMGHAPSWETCKGTRCYIETTSGIRIVGIPTDNDALNLSVYRLPLSDMVELTDEPEIRVERRYDLLDGMLSRAYLKHDSETYNPKLAADHEARFTQHFGAKIDASARKKQRTYRSNVTRINW